LKGPNRKERGTVKMWKTTPLKEVQLENLSFSEEEVSSLLNPHHLEGGIGCDELRDVGEF